MKNFKMRLVTLLMAVITMLSVFPASAFAATSENPNSDLAVENVENESASLNITYTTGWGQSWLNKGYYTEPECEEQLISSGLAPGVGFTIIAETDISYQIDTYGANGLWILKGMETVDTTNCTAGDIRYTTTVYSAAGSNVGYSIGTLYANDIVTILAKSGNYYFIEFNDSTYLRKRGWINKDSVLRRGISDVSTIDTIIGDTSRVANQTINLYWAPGEGYSWYNRLYAGDHYSIVQYTTIHGHDYALISYLVSINGSNKLALAYIKV